MNTIDNTNRFESILSCSKGRKVYKLNQNQFRIYRKADFRAGTLYLNDNVLRVIENNGYDYVDIKRDNLKGGYALRFNKDNEGISIKINKGGGISNKELVDTLYTITGNAEKYGSVVIDTQVSDSVGWYFI